MTFEKAFKKRFGIVLAAFALCTAAAQPREIRFEPVTGELAYGLAVIPPWADGGRLIVNFPEHLEAGETGDIGILRYYKAAPGGGWKVAPDGRSAVLDAESNFTPGVHVHAEGKVAGADRIEFVFAITNNTARPLAAVNPLYCHHYAGLTGFAGRAAATPAAFPNFEHVYAFVGGRLTRMSEIPLAKPQSRVRGANVLGCPQQESDFARNHGGKLPTRVDAAITAVTSLDHRKKLIVAWTPGKSFLSNAEIPCIHADPFYGTIEPGQTAEARGVLMLTEGDLEAVMTGLLKLGAGKFQQ